MFPVIRMMSHDEFEDVDALLSVEGPEVTPEEAAKLAELARIKAAYVAPPPPPPKFTHIQLDEQRAAAECLARLKDGLRAIKEDDSRRSAEHAANKAAADSKFCAASELLRAAMSQHAALMRPAAAANAAASDAEFDRQVAESKRAMDEALRAHNARMTGLTTERDDHRREIGHFMRD